MKLACANSDWLKADLASAFEKAASDFPVENESFLDLNLATKDSGKRQQDNILIRKANSYIDPWRWRQDTIFLNCVSSIRFPVSSNYKVALISFK